MDIEATAAERAARSLSAAGIESFAHPADVTQTSAVSGFVAAILDRWGRLDIAVNNAGVNYTSPSETAPLSEWDATLALNLRGVWLCCQAEGQVMLGHRAGVIINIASAASIVVPHPQKQAAYNTAKAGVVHLTRSLAAEWADRGVRVHAISPGFIKTALIQRSPALRSLTDEWLDQIPMRHLGSVSDLQGAAVFLVSDAASYMTGQNLVIDGGHSLW